MFTQNWCIDFLGFNIIGLTDIFLSINVTSLQSLTIRFLLKSTTNSKVLTSTENWLVENHIWTVREPSRDRSLKKHWLFVADDRQLSCYANAFICRADSTVFGRFNLEGNSGLLRIKNDRQLWSRFGHNYSFPKTGWSLEVGNQNLGVKIEEKEDKNVSRKK